MTLEGSFQKYYYMFRKAACGIDRQAVLQYF